MRPLMLIAWFMTLALPHYAAAVEFSTVDFAGKRFTVCRVNVRHDRLLLFLRDETREPYKRFDRLATALVSQNRKLVFAMNAGMFHSDFSAVGLFVSDGQESAPLNRADGTGNFFLKPNGVFVVTDSGAHILESSEYPSIHERVILATQSGPLLVQRGKLHSALNPTSTSRLLRNGVGVPSPVTALFVISEEPVNFHEFATLFRDKLLCQDALFLDGTISSLHAPKLKRSDLRAELGPIIAVVE